VELEEEPKITTHGKFVEDLCSIGSLKVDDNTELSTIVRGTSLSYN
jgi:hypothetical protein